MGIIDRLKSWAVGEGSWRGPFSGIGEYGNSFIMGRLDDGWQTNLRVDAHTMQQIPVISGARLLYRNAFAQLRPEHHKYESSGEIKTISTSAAASVLMQPNDYETGADLHGRVIDHMIMHGEALLIVQRDDRQAVKALHLVPAHTWSATIHPTEKAIYYAVNPDGVIAKIGDASMMVPSRDVCHMRWSTPRHSLIGESPLAAAGLAAGINVALSQSQAVFFNQMRRPSGVLTTDQKLNAEQIEILRAAWDNQSKNLNQGGMPILSAGMKFQPLSISSQDAEVVSALRMSNEEIARALGIPPPLLGDLSNSTLSSTEQLVSAWLAFSLGGMIERYERSLDRVFGFNSRTNRIEMNTDGLLRTDLAARMDALGKGVMQGVLTPNEARRREGLTPLDGGNDAFMQRQQTPVSALAQLAAMELAPPEPPLVAPPAPEALPEDEQKVLAFDYLKRSLAS